MVVELAIQGLTALANPFIQPIFLNFLYWTLQSLATILSFWVKGDRIQDENDVVNFKNTKSFDFIVVGGGSAGGVVAHRLSRANYNVLLLEAGGDPNPLQMIPRFGLFLINYQETDWMHKTVPQKFASLNSINQQSSWSTGLGLGGTGNLNLMIHLRGHKKDFDYWANITGDPEWSWEGVLPHFKSYEDYEVLGDNENHGYRGELRIERPDYIGLAPEFVRAAEELGYPNVDLNAPYTEGFDIIRYPIKRGVRQATYKAFIEPVRYLPTLTILKYSHVNKIIFKDNVAIGVQFDRHGVPQTAYASKEVIISAGTVNTPKILKLSGIGPKKELEELNIPVISDLPVGENLQDHIAVYLSPFLMNVPRATFLDRDITPSSFVKWFTTGRGQLSSTGCEASGLVSSEFAKARGEGDWPDIQVFLYSFTVFRTAAFYLGKAFGLKEDELTKYYKDDVGVDASHLVVSGARPFSRGYVRLGGSSPYDKPIIDPRYLSDPGDVDLKVLLEGVKTSLLLMENTTAFGDLGVRFTDKKLPGCEHLEFRTDPYWECFIRRYSITLHHPVGTASMGSVVDTELKVIGTQNLRVMDSSIQPVIVTTNTQASAIMIGEKGSHMLLKYWNDIRFQEQQLKKASLKNSKWNKIF
ncbi:unnamed protein product [Orchesella dallaii]|uniref:Glucose-methanol-choline oxidoreductase N-terminal domain-containing protein n=1 Tax=Orchesella dallaii TaxID=48710 RepID=A0ABP1Q951_9HEXA